MYEFINSKEEKNIGIITLNRPEVLNAWHKSMRDEMVIEEVNGGLKLNEEGLYTRVIIGF